MLRTMWALAVCWIGVSVHALGATMLRMHHEEYTADSTQRSTHTLGIVEVSAQRSNTVNNTVATQHITRESIKKQGITDLADALRRMTGTTVKDYGGAGGMKTLSVRSMGATHTAVIYDGIAVTNCESGQIDLSRFSLDQIDQLSLTVGDDSNIFLPARNIASAATLHLSSRAPQFNEQKSYNLSGRVQTGSFGMMSPSFRYEKALSPSWSMRAQGEYLRADNQYDFTLKNVDLVTKEKRYNNELHAGRGELDFYYQPLHSRSSLSGKVYYYETDKELPGPVVYYNPISHEQQRFRNTFQQLSYRTSWPCHLALQINAKANWSENLYHDEGKQYKNEEKNDYYRQQDYYTSVALLYSPLEQLSFSTATDYAYTTLRSNAIEAVAPMRHTILSSLAAKYQTEWITATSTLLYSNYINDTRKGTASQNAHRLSPSVSMVLHHPQMSWWRIRVSYKDIFRMPTFADNYYTWLGSRDLKPEKAQQINLGVSVLSPTKNQQNHVELHVDAYTGHVKDKIVAMPKSLFHWNMVNVGKVQLYGVETRINTATSLHQNLQIETNWSYSYQYAVNMTEPDSRYYKDQIAYTPRHNVAGSVTMLTPWLNISVHGTAMSKRYSTNENMEDTRIEPHHEFGISAWQIFRLKNRTTLELRGDITNLTDEQYEIVRSYPMPGQAWKLSLYINY